MATPKISDEKVIEATGKNWKEWFSILDKAGAKIMNHTEIADLVYEKHLAKKESGGWWSQMVTVEYERSRGLRKVHQQTDGFRVAVHKTLPGTVSSLQRKWAEVSSSQKVASQKLERIPSKTKRALLRYQAKVGKVEVFFDDRGKDKARIAIEAIRLPKESDVEPARKFWRKILDQMEEKEDV